MDLFLKALVHPVKVLLLDTDLPVAYRIAYRIKRRFLLNLSGHRAPF
ncbi:hypothetical protein [Streptomyces sp. NPDC050704]